MCTKSGGDTAMMSSKKWVSACAAGLALVGSVIAHAQTSPAPLYASKSFRDAASAVQARLNANDIAGAEGRLVTLTASSQLERYMLGALKLETASRRNDFRGQWIAVNEMLSSGAAPAEQLGYLRYLSGYLASQTGSYEDAIKQLLAARQAGYTSPSLNLLLADNYVRRKNGTDALAAFQQAVTLQDAAGKVVPVEWLDKGAAIASSAKNWSAFAQIQSRRLTKEASPGAWRSATANYILGAVPDAEAKLDLLRLQNATDALASERDYEAYAATASSLGRASEAKSIIEAGQRDGKLLNGNPAIAPLLSKSSASAAKNLSEMESLKGKSSKVASAVAAVSAGDRLLSGALYDEAAAYYRAALVKGTSAKDKVNTRLGIALSRSGNHEGAKAAFGQVKGAWADVAAFWGAWNSISATKDSKAAVK
jgi:hypothetical protein